ncbi:MAG: hypothetical protein ACQGVC_11755 [Myxococcota bacterium]
MARLRTASTMLAKPANATDTSAIVWSRSAPGMGAQYGTGAGARASGYAGSPV